MVEYQCKATYLPFCINNREKYEVFGLNKIYTHLIHLEWKVVNMEKSIYRSHWVMSYDVFWWLENRDKIAYDEMVNYAALNNGYLQRIKEEDSQLQKGVQMSLF